MTTKELIEMAEKYRNDITDGKICDIYDMLCERLELAYKDIETWEKTGMFCLGCSHFSGTEHTCEKCEFEWRGNKE